MRTFAQHLPRYPIADIMYQSPESLAGHLTTGILHEIDRTPSVYTALLSVVWDSHPSKNPCVVFRNLAQWAMLPYPTGLRSLKVSD